MQTKFFDCMCNRCKDPTELGTHLSSLVCPKCCLHFSVPEYPLNTEGHWKCQDEQCNYKMCFNDVQQLLDCLQRKADAISYDDLSGLETFLAVWSPVLHPNHSILLGIKYYLCQFYGNAPGYSLEQLPLRLLKRKMALCQNLLAIAHVLEPGNSKLQCKHS